MGVYLIVIASHDVSFRNEYNRHARKWMASWGCQFTGLLAMTSSEVSIFILTYMSMERYISIAHPYRPTQTSSKKSMLSISLIWIFGIILGVVPIFSKSVFGDFYGTNGVCFPLHIHDPYLQGWQYSVFVFLVLDLFSMVAILFCYVGMFVSIQRTRKRVHTTSRDTSFAKRFFVIVFTDALCWIPIITIKLLAFSGITISGK